MVSPPSYCSIDVVFVAANAAPMMQRSRRLRAIDFSSFADKGTRGLVVCSQKVVHVRICE